MVIYSLQHDMGWGSMNNVKPRITLNLYEMCFSPQHCFKRKILIPVGFSGSELSGNSGFADPCPPCPCRATNLQPSVPSLLVSIDGAGEGREESLTFAAGSRCCRSTAGSAGFRWNLPLHNTLIFFPPSYRLWMQIRMDNFYLFSFLTNFPLFCVIYICRPLS